MRATSIELDERQYSVSPIHGEAALPPSEGPSVRPNGSRKTVSSEQNTTPKSIIRRRWDRSCSAPTEIPKRTDSLSPELGPPLTFKIRKKHLNTAADVDIATSKTPPPRAVSAPRYSNMRVYVRDVEEESLRFFEIPYSWHPDEPDCFTLLRDMSDADMEAVFRYTKKLRATSNRSGDGVSQPAREQLAALKKTLDETVWPQCEALKTSPPTDVEARQGEYDLMSQLLVREMVFSVSAVEAGEDNQAKMDKVELLMECHRIMQALDEIIRQRYSLPRHFTFQKFRHELQYLPLTISHISPESTMAEDEEDDYLSMSFLEPAAATKETSLQRTARLRKEAAERGRIPSKAERTNREKEEREKALSTQLDASNKGAKMMAKMGFKGGALGKTEGARTQPIEVNMKDDRGGIGMDSEKKRKIREAAEAMEWGEKKRKAGEDEYRTRTREEKEGKRNEGMMWSAMRTLESFETEQPDDGDDDVELDKKKGKNTRKPMGSINILWRPLVKQRLEKERERRRRYDLEQSLSRRTDYDDPDADEDDKLAYGHEVEELDDEDEELNEFEAINAAERLEKIIDELRRKYCYCFWCKFKYDNEVELADQCPGPSEDVHG
ncbi:Hypothetical protein R9X50_00547700 [Acrodontium crateriforme]|uniref:G-patch domain-containing protein n=1 Tax=Acrodontium crateriforme TaxID=150365 RepID=A0AAQ3MCM2_9PEZI|nr:Hypothetical protein R9X50_00547700 [Acrodontium crateriforme]